MPRIPAAATLRLVVPALVAGCIVTVLFAWEGRLGLSLWDEGFLWYGAQRVTLGEVPIRDCQAYDPGRYYWLAALMGLWGDNGIIALRGAIAIFQAMGLFHWPGVARQQFHKTDSLFGCWHYHACNWMLPRHKLFDISISIALVGVLSYLVAQPSSRRYFSDRRVVGLAAVFGQNHGVYGVAGSLGVMAYLAIRALGFSRARVAADVLWQSVLLVGVGGVLAVPLGFALSLWRDILFLLELKATNLPLAVPWPWRVPFGQTSPLDAARGVLVGLFFIAIVAYGLLGIAWAWSDKAANKPASPCWWRPHFLALPYAHFAYSRADVGHLAQGISLSSSAPLCCWQASLQDQVAVCYTALWRKLLVMLPLHPGDSATGLQCVETDVAGGKLKIDPGTASDLAMLNKLADQFAPGNRSFIATPFWPGAYATLGRKSPMWEIYALFPRGEAFERAELERIRTANPGFAMIYDLPLDTRDELRFRNTHPMIDQYIRDHFEPVSGYTQNPGYHLYRAKQATR
jgi:hypothetical protein